MTASGAISVFTCPHHPSRSPSPETIPRIANGVHPGGRIGPQIAEAPAPSERRNSSGRVRPRSRCPMSDRQWVRFANLGGRRELFVPLSQARHRANELVLVVGRCQAPTKARRSLEILPMTAEWTRSARREGGRANRPHPLVAAKAREGF